MVFYKKGLIIINSFNTTKSYLYCINRFKDAFKRLNIDIDIKKSSEIHVIIERKLSVLIDNYDFCIFYDKDILLAKALEMSGLKVFNSSRAIEICDNKYLTHLMLSKSNIKMPKTINGLLCYSPSYFYDTKYIDFVIKELGFPLVFKESYGSLGKNVYLIENREDLEKIVEKKIYKSYIFQEYIKESKGRDIRVIVIGNKVIGAMERVNKNDFRSNIALGGIGYKFEINKKIGKIAVKTSKKLKLDYCGIDILLKNDEPLICEVNSNAFFEEFEKICGIDIAFEYANYIFNKIYFEKMTK